MEWNLPWLWSCSVFLTAGLAPQEAACMDWTLRHLLKLSSLLHIWVIVDFGQKQTHSISPLSGLSEKRRPPSGLSQELWKLVMQQRAHQPHPHDLQPQPSTLQTCSCNLPLSSSSSSQMPAPDTKHEHTPTQHTDSALLACEKNIKLPCVFSSHPRAEDKSECRITDTHYSKSPATIPSAVCLLQHCQISKCRREK